MKERSNVELFNIVAGLILDQLYTSFPIPLDIDDVSIANAMDAEVTINEEQSQIHGRCVATFGKIDGRLNFNGLLWHSQLWLRDEGYIRAEGQAAHLNAVLTSKALAAMNAQPASLAQPLGTKLRGAVGSIATDAGRTAVAETVGQIIGAATRAMFTP